MAKSYSSGGKKVGGGTPRGYSGFPSKPTARLQYSHRGNPGTTWASGFKPARTGTKTAKAGSLQRYLGDKAEMAGTPGQPMGAGGGDPDSMASLQQMIQDFLNQDVGGEMPSPPQVPTGGGGGPAKIPTQLQSALDVDSSRMQQAADRQYGRNKAVTDAFERFLGQGGLGGLGERLQEGLGEFDEMGDYADQMSRMKDPSGAIGEAKRTAREVGGDFEQARSVLMGALGEGRNAITASEKGASEFAQGIAGLGDMVDEDAAAVASAIRKDAMAQMQMAKVGVHPDGTPMTSAERTDVMLRVQGETSQRVAMAVQPILSQWHQVRAGLQGQLAQVRQQVAAVRGQQGQLQAGVGSALGELARVEGTLQFERGVTMQREMELRRSWGELAGTMRQMRESLRQASMLQAVQLEMQGRTAYAELVRNNPETIVSRFQGMLALYAAASAASGSATVR